MESAERTGSLPDLSTETDEDLLVYMTMRDEDSSVAQEALAEFYRRHAGYVYGVCRRVSQGVLDGSGAEDIMQDTFLRVFDKAATFRNDELTDPDRLRLRVRAWLSRVATNVFRTELRTKRRKQAGIKLVPLEEGEDESLDHPEAAENCERAQIKQMVDCLDTLSVKEQQVLRVTWQYYEPAKPNQHLPQDVVEDLATSLQTTSPNIRQIRSRAMKKLKACMESSS